MLLLFFLERYSFVVLHKIVRFVALNNAARVKGKWVIGKSTSSMLTLLVRREKWHFTFPLALPFAALLSFTAKKVIEN